MKLINKVKKHFREIAKTKKSPHAIALGFALGTMIGILPTPVISVFLGLLMILIFKNISKYALFIAIAFWNPFVMSPIYYYSFRLGTSIFGNVEPTRFSLHLLNVAYEWVLKYLVGNLILAVSISALSYLVIRASVAGFRKKYKEIE